MTHVLFLSVPLHGHILPSLPVVAELVARGHRVSYAATADFAGFVTEAGATAVPYTTSFPVEGASKALPRDDAEGALMFLDEAITALPQVAEALAGDPPDVVVYDMGAMHGPILAEKWGVPAVQLSPSHVTPRGVTQILGISQAEAPPGIVEFQRRFEDFVAGQGVRVRPEEIMARPRRCVVTIPRAFQIETDGITDQHTFVGPMIDDRAPEPWPDDHGKPIVLVSLGSAFRTQTDFYRTCVEAFRGTEWHAVLALGKFIDPADLGPLPDNVEAHAWVPLASVLVKAKAFVTQAGMGGTMTALYHEVPQVAVPLMAGQPLTARRLVELGLGAHLPPEDVTPESLLAAVRQVAGNESIKTELRRMRKEIEACGGAPLAADVVLSTVDGEV